MRNVWAVTSYDNGGNSGHQVEHVFTMKEAAEHYAATHRYNTHWGGLRHVWYMDGRDGDEYDVEKLTLYEEGDELPVDEWAKPENRVRRQSPRPERRER